MATPNDCDALYRLQEQLNCNLHQQGFHVEKRAFRPHVSLARVRDIPQPIDLSEGLLAILRYLLSR